MAYSGQAFPTLVFGNRFRNTKSGMSWPVQVAGNGPFEYRTLRSAYPRLSWTIPARNLTYADGQTLVQFCAAMGGQLQSFRFTDLVDNTLNAYTLTVDANGDYPLVVPVRGQLHPLYHTDGLTITGGGTVTTINGFPIITGAATAPQLTGTFSLCARFAAETAFTLLNAVNPSQAPLGMEAIKLLEVFE